MSSSKITKAPTPLQFEYITWVEQHWFEHKIFPSVTLAAKALNITSDKINEFINNETVQKMLSNRGIEIEVIDTSVLTEEQLAAANAYLNLADPRPISVKLKDLGINPTRFNGWMRGKAFSRYLQERAEELFTDGMPFAHRELMNKVMQGDLKAIRLFYEVSGRYTGPQSTEAQSVVVIVQRLLEAIQLEINDPALIERVGRRFQSIMAGEAIGAEKVQPRAALPVGTSISSDPEGEVPMSTGFGHNDERKVTVVREGESDTI